MVKIKGSLLTFVILMISSTLAEEEGDSCIFQRTWTLGACKKLGDCRIAILAFKAGIRPQICTFAATSTVPVVCCAGSVPSRPPPRSNTSGECPPAPATAVKITKNGQKARDYCIDLINTIFRCRPSYNGDSIEREELCSHYGRSVSTGLELAGMNEFPHMALLGYGDTPESAVWECGGTLINKRWVMTAAHCLFARSAGSEVKFIRLGSPEVSAQLDKTKLFDVTRIIEHPDLVPGQIYHDIALLQLNRDASFGRSVIPACLHTDPAVTNMATITGWGSHYWRNNSSREMLNNILQKVTLEEFSYAECSLKYSDSPKTRLPRGIDNETQICYGSRQEIKGSCRGDSGGPLQIQNENVFCTYTVIGILSRGRGCATPGIPEIYTRVAAYIPWIESVAWPEIL